MSSVGTMHADMSKYENELLQEVKANPADPISLGGLANFISLDQERRGEALETFERALEACHGDGSVRGEVEQKWTLCYSVFASLFATFLMNSDGAGLGEGWVRKAEELYKKALVLDPENPLGMPDYAVFLHRVKKSYKEAEEQVRMEGTNMKAGERYHIAVSYVPKVRSYNLNLKILSH